MLRSEWLETVPQYQLRITWNWKEWSSWGPHYMCCGMCNEPSSSCGNTDLGWSPDLSPTVATHSKHWQAQLPWRNVHTRRYVSHVQATFRQGGGGGWTGGRGRCTMRFKMHCAPEQPYGIEPWRKASWNPHNGSPVTAGALLNLWCSEERLRIREHTKLTEK